MERRLNWSIDSHSRSEIIMEWVQIKKGADENERTENECKQGQEKINGMKGRRMINQTLGRSKSEIFGFPFSVIITMKARKANVDRKTRHKAYRCSMSRDCVNQSVKNWDFQIPILDHNHNPKDLESRWRKQIHKRRKKDKKDNGEQNEQMEHREKKQ